MRHHNTVFHAILKHVPWPVLDRLVDRFQANKKVRRLTTQDQFKALLYAQLAGNESLRAIVADFASHAGKLYHLGTGEVSRSTLADANAQRPCGVFAGLLAELMSRCDRRLGRQLADAVYLIDSTGFRLSSLSADWARFTAGVSGAKLHIVYNPDTARPNFAEVTAANVNDITVAKLMPITPGATYVFDLGYYDYGWWAKLDAAGCRIVTRLKVNTPLAGVVDNPLPVGSLILSDRIGHLPARQARSRINPFQDPVRELRVRTETGTILRVVTNDLDAPADEIAELYKRRWQIELFFRWVKHALKIRHFFGTSENAVRIQIAVALVAFLLLRTAHSLQNSVPSLLAFTRLVANNLMHRRRIDRLLDPPPPAPEDLHQLSLNLCQT
ncbi:MAG: IS4 family transposase [Hyphomicrobiales bacterium]|nr:IS4 family transposase [Hyphomicrobiales bacterium]